MFSTKGTLLRVFVSEDDKKGNQPLFEWILQEARKSGLAGATAIRGHAGYGAESHMHTAKVLRLSANLPIIVEIVDQRDKIEAFMPTIDSVLQEGIATLEEVEVHFFEKK
ncbi:MAG: DUF190 domain-containing protein [Verrucomicrobia bacterium]|nr:DUF190 domain-containing protein [Verrucomicrobiota bacterium]